LTDPGGSRASFAKALLKAIGAPLSAGNIKAVTSWETIEGGGFGNQAANNPMNLNPGKANWPGHNADGAWAFPTLADGLKYTAQYLGMSNYSGILSALKADTKGSGISVINAIMDSPWAQSHYGHDAHSFPGYAGGTVGAAGGLTWVGERGPELMDMAPGTRVATNAASKSAAKGTAQTPWTAQLANITAGGNRTGASQGQPMTINFGDINIGGTSAGASAPAAQNAREFVREVRQLLQKEDLFSNIAGGVK
jgi:hypothetical protein